MKKCINRRCNKELPDDYGFCPYCGKNQSEVRRKEPKRPNGTGSIYIRKDNKSKPYAAASSLSGKQVYLGSFATRTEAVQALKDYEYNPVTSYNITLEQLHEEWQKIAYKKLGKSVQQNYNSAWYKLRPLYKRKFRDIRTGEMQAIIDFYEAPHHEIGVEGKPNIQLEKLRQNIGIIPYADYIFAMCYLNFRISEFLELTVDSYHISETGIPVFIGGKKTEAGTDRLVPIHKKIQPIVQSCIEKHGETVFCDEDGRALTSDRFRKQCFYPAIQTLGFPDDLTPHSCRRTFSTRMSAAGARQEDIIALMGHTNFDVDINHYINQETETLYNAIMKMA